MVSFTFDDVPKSAATVGAPILEEYGGRATFYIAGSLVSQWSGLWAGIDADEIIGLHRNGHEIACHTFSHRRTTELDAAAMEAEIEQNGRYFHELDASIRLENFAYPYGLASVARKGQLGNSFRSSRGILPGVNRGLIDLQFLRATPLVDEHIDTGGIERSFDEAAGLRRLADLLRSRRGGRAKPVRMHAAALAPRGAGRVAAEHPDRQRRGGLAAGRSVGAGRDRRCCTIVMQRN